MKYLILIAVILIVLPVDVVNAASFGGFVNCDGADCSACNLVYMINEIIVWLFGIIFVIFAVLMLVAGFGLVTSGGNQSALDAAKKKFQNAIIGIIIVMAAWLLVDTMMKTLLKGTDGVIPMKGFGPWSEVQCQTQAKADEYLGGGLISEAGIPSTVTGPAVPTGNLVVYAGYKFDEGILDKVKYLDNNFDLTVSGGHRTPERNAQVGGVANSNHLTGRAADFVGSSAAMSAGLAWAKANGAKEALIHNVGSGTHLHVAF